jgi:phage host-nuclease inhibitor protein Gam
MARRESKGRDYRREVGGRLRRLARAEARLRAAESELEEELQEVRRRREPRVERLRRRVENLRGRLEEFCRAERADMLRDGRKSLKTPFGRVGFRSRRPAVSVADGAAEDHICRRLAERGLDGVVRVKRRINRRALRRAVEAGRLSAEELSELGLELAERPDAFQCSTAVGEPLASGGGRG